ncbi:MAG: hypothetical protein JWN34_4493 [Bryobacterales bacterium]|nr:hypothetical protein [Bryobacterales bacterium]
MIAIRKGPPPKELLRRGVVHAQQLCADYDGDPAGYQSGERKMVIRKSIYASSAVKSALEAAHFGKCCYCETWIPKPYAHAHVEHWRPFSCSRQGPEEGRISPGYYWLAYSWDNLFLSCAFCNSSNKVDIFPLTDPATRARNHRMSFKDESPAILKPDGDEDPRQHIKFVEEEPVGQTDPGRETIKVLGLGSKLHESRLTHLKRVRDARAWSIKLMESSDARAREFALKSMQFVEDAAKPDQPYSAMVADYLAANPWPEPVGKSVEPSEATAAAIGTAFD